MAKINVALATEAALDYLVGLSEGLSPQVRRYNKQRFSIVVDHEGQVASRNWSPTLDWKQGIQILDREKIQVRQMPDGWRLHCVSDVAMPSTPTAAAYLTEGLRFAVARRLGWEVEIPDELGEVEESEDTTMALF